MKQILLAIEDVTERVRLEASTRKRNIATLLQELAHRIKNNLQAITAMIRLEAGRQMGGMGKAALERVSDRIAAIGRLYSKLEKADTIEAVDAATYLEEMCADLMASVQRAGRAISLTTDIENVPLPTQQAIPIGLIVNELVMNAVKYAFPSETGGTIMVTLDRRPGGLRLTVADDGSGIDPQRADSGLGGRLVDSFAQQLGGIIERDSGRQGTTVRLTFPVGGTKRDADAHS